MLDRALVEEVLVAARRRGGSFAELFVEERSNTSVRLDDGKVEELTTGLDRGAGVRVGAGDQLRIRLLEPARPRRPVERGRRGLGRAGRGRGGIGRRPPRGAGADRNRAERPADQVAAAQKVAWLREVDETARSFSPEVVQVVGVYGDSLQRRLIATSDGRCVQEDRPRIRLVAQVIARAADNIQTGFEGPAACAGVEFIDVNGPRVDAEIAARRAVTMLDSIPAPAGEMPVVLGPGCGGVLFHEAVGHPLESDAVDKEASVYRGRVGETLASPARDRRRRRDDPERLGSYGFDDEGSPAQRTVLFDQGVLQGLLYDRLRAEKDGRAETGNGRRESYAYPPIAAHDEHATSSRRVEGLPTSSPTRASGVYVTAMGGGQVNPATGDFVFGVAEGYLIEDGGWARRCAART